MIAHGLSTMLNKRTVNPQAVVVESWEFPVMWKALVHRRQLSRSYNLLLASGTFLRSFFVFDQRIGCTMHDLERGLGPNSTKSCPFYVTPSQRLSLYTIEKIPIY